MRTLMFTTSLAIGATAAQADGHYSQLLAENGPGRAAAQLETTGVQTPSDQFAMGGLQFLAAVEGALQTRYTYDLTSDRMNQIADVPFLRLPIAPNPAPKPFDPAAIEMIFVDAIAHLGSATDSLDTISGTDTVVVGIALADLWFDINSNGQRESGEGFISVVGNVLGETPDTPIATDIVIQFDTADAAWLSAYAHMLSGMSELILSTDPAPALASVLDGAQAMDKLRGHQLQRMGFFGGDELPLIDAFAGVVVALEGPLDRERTRAAHQHFLDAIADNREFWTRLDAETDNAAEWVPNSRQQSALPLQFPSNIGDGWQAVLADAEDVLTGTQLLPHWRLGQGAGLNLAKMLQDPPVVDVIGLFQGYSLAPYAERGRVVSFDSMREFDEMTGGNSPLFAIILN